jgi:hypothetical protein
VPLYETFNTPARAQPRIPCKHSSFSAKPRSRSCKDPERSDLISVCKVRRRNRIRRPQARSAQACPEDVGTPGLARARVSAAVSPSRRPRSFRDLPLGGLTSPKGLAGRSFAPGALALRPCALPAARTPTPLHSQGHAVHSLAPRPVAWTAVQSSRVRPSRLHDPRHAVASTPVPVLSADPESTCSQSAPSHACEASQCAVPGSRPSPCAGSHPPPLHCAWPDCTCLQCMAPCGVGEASQCAAAHPTELDCKGRTRANGGW